MAVESEPTKEGLSAGLSVFVAPPRPTPWPKANTRLLGLAAGLPVDPAKRLAGFSPEEFERFALEWIDGYLSEKYVEVQSRGGAGDQGRDLIGWIDLSSVLPRRADIYQCKHYKAKLGPSDVLPELGKLLYYTHRGDYPVPETYWLVSQKGVTGPMQNKIDAPAKLKAALISQWDKYCQHSITDKEEVLLSGKLLDHIENFPFHIVRVMQPLELLKQHAQTKYHLRVFGKPLVERPPPPMPPSEVDPIELKYVTQIYDGIAERFGVVVKCPEDFKGNTLATSIFQRARLTFYSAEGLKQLCRDSMDSADYFETLLDEFFDGLFMTYSMDYKDSLLRMMKTIEQAGVMQLGAHELAPLVEANDRAGICHQLANALRFVWKK